MNIEKIRLEQTLHGYNNGHSLLASSLEIDSETKRLLLLMSDMSGPSMINGFEEYITAYPIKEINHYALAKTWYAQEMKRPGCVWTHTILIHFSDLYKLENNPKDILSLFKRPEIESDFSDFKEKIDFSTFKNDYFHRTYPNRMDSIIFKNLIFSLYSDANKHTVIQSQKAGEWDELMILIWQQQWPRLQRNFTFCTGSIKPRNFRGDLLDLQIVPFKVNIEDEKKEFDIVNQNINLIDNKSFEWVNCIIDDLIRPSNLRQFLKEYGSDIKAPRNSFSKLTLAYLYVTKNIDVHSITNIIKFIKDYFPSKSDANLLKTAILGMNTSSEFEAYLKFNEDEVIKELAVTPYFSVFDYAKLNFESHVISLFKDYPIRILKDLNEIIHLDLNPYGESILRDIAHIAIKNVTTLFSHPEFKNLLNVFAALNPEFYNHIEFWKINNKNIGEILNALSKSNVLEINWQQIIDILISLNTDVDVAFLNFDADRMTKYIFSVIDKTNSRPNYSWVKFLRSNPISLLNWAKEAENPQKLSIQLLIEILESDSKIICQFGFEPSIKLLSLNSLKDDYKIRTNLCCFALALGFNLFERQSKILIAMSFEEVYLAARGDKLYFAFWRYIEKHTEPLSWWNDWDKCKKLLKLLVKHVIINNWNIDFLLSTFKDSELRSRLTSTYEKAK